MEELVLSHSEIEDITKRLGEQISKDLANEEKTPLFVVVMKGALNFMASLLNNLTIPLVTDYVQVSSYEGTKQTGKVKFKHMLETDPTGRTIVIVEDVVDTGLTIRILKDYLNTSFSPKKVLVCSLFDKVNCRKVDEKVDYAGKVLEKNKFLIGFGLDYDELERNVPYVYTPTKEDLDKLNERLAKDKAE